MNSIETNRRTDNNWPSPPCKGLSTLPLENGGIVITKRLVPGERNIGGRFSGKALPVTGG